MQKIKMSVITEIVFESVEEILAYANHPDVGRITGYPNENKSGRKNWAGSVHTWLQSKLR